MNTMLLVMRLYRYFFNAAEFKYGQFNCLRLQILTNVATEILVRELNLLSFGE